MSILPSWATSGLGQPPEAVWSRSLEGELVAMAVAWETDDIVLADSLGGISIWNREGHMVHVTRGYPNLKHIAFSANGTHILASFGRRKLVLFDRRLKMLWRTNHYDTIRGIALDPFGRHMAVSNGAHDLHILTTDRKNVAELETIRPLAYLCFAMARPFVVAAAEDGLLAGIEFRGDLAWEERLFSTTGDLAINGNATRIVLAGFSHGLQRYNAAGMNRGTYIVDGTPAQVSVSYSGEHLAVATLEQHLYRVRHDGQPLWGAFVPEKLVDIHLNAKGDALTVGTTSGQFHRLDWSAAAGLAASAS